MKGSKQSANNATPNIIMKSTTVHYCNGVNFMTIGKLLMVIIT